MPCNHLWGMLADGRGWMRGVGRLKQADGGTESRRGRPLVLLRTLPGDVTDVDFDPFRGQDTGL